MNYTFSKIQSIIQGKLVGKSSNEIISNIEFDTRKIADPSSTAFIAIIARRDGHDFVQQAYDKGIRFFIVSRNLDGYTLPEAHVISVEDTVVALQMLGEYHRQNSSCEVIGITGSNGKTIVKEWLSSVLSMEKTVLKSPKGWNSLIGVPLSILQINDEDIAVIETGISQYGEMAVMERMVSPALGIMTNIGDAHDSGFDNIHQKIAEKLTLFKTSKSIVYCKDHVLIDSAIQEIYPSTSLISWSLLEDHKAKYNFSIHHKGRFNFITCRDIEGTIIFTSKTLIKSKAYIENLCHCITGALHVGINPSSISTKIEQLKMMPYRSKVIEGKNDCIIIDDSYSFDLQSFRSSIALLQDNMGDKGKKAIIISDVDTHNQKESFYQEIMSIAQRYEVDQVYHVGHDGTLLSSKEGDVEVISFENIISLQRYFIENGYDNRGFLIKGARRFELEKISDFLSAKTHSATLEINLDRISHNISAYSKVLNAVTKIISIIKAEAYGSGSLELGRHLEKQGVYGVAVATIDEGVQLRKHNLQLPILILNPIPDGFHLLAEYDLEPEIYSIELLEQLLPYLKDTGENLKIHIKLDTGMNRLGLRPHEYDRMASLIRKSDARVESIFSHLASSSNPDVRPFTLQQIERFDKGYTTLTSLLGYQPMKHILNSGGIAYYPAYQYDAVRLGIGMYGITSNPNLRDQVKKVHRLTAKIAQIKTVDKGETIGYGADFFIEERKSIALVPIGYADGINRMMSHGNVSFYINGYFVPTIGYICMDMLMLDITGCTGIDTHDEVEIFGDNVDICTLAERCQTIPYEILSKISQRVKRVYIHD